MKTQRLFTAGIILGLCALSLGAAVAPSAAADSDAWSTSTVTHVEYDGSMFTKLVEMTKVMPSSMIAQTETSHSRSGADINLLGALQVEINEGYPLTVVRLSLFKISFTKAVVLNDQISSAPGATIPSYDENPFKEAIPFDQPLFSVLDTVFFVARKGDEPVVKHELDLDEDKAVATRFRVLDSLVFCLFQRDSWNDGQFAEEWFELPFTYTFHRENSRQRRALRIVDSAFATLFRYNNEEGVETVDLFGTFIASVFKSRKSREGKSKWVLLDLPMISLVNSTETAKERQFTFLGTTSFSSSMKSRRGGPAFALWHSERSEDTGSRWMLARLPFIGPIWGSWEDGGKKRQGPFPRLVYWKSYRQ